MKMLIATLLMLIASASHATYLAGVSDLLLAPSPVAFYEFVNKEPRSGMDKPLWHLNHGKDDGTVQEVAHVGVVMSWNIIHGDPAVCASAGVGIGAIGSMLGNLVVTVAPDAPDVPVFLKDAANFITVEGFGGHEIAGPKWVGGIGGKVKVQYDLTSLAGLFH